MPTNSATKIVAGRLYTASGGPSCSSTPSFITATRSDQEEAFSMSDRVAVMNEGVLEQEGPPEAVYRRPATIFVAEFVGMANRLAAAVTGSAGAGYVVRLA